MNGWVELAKLIGSAFGAALIQDSMYQDQVRRKEDAETLDFLSTISLQGRTSIEARYFENQLNNMASDIDLRQLATEIILRDKQMGTKMRSCKWFPTRIVNMLAKHEIITTDGRDMSPGPALDVAMQSAMAQGAYAALQRGEDFGGPNEEIHISICDKCGCCGQTFKSRGKTVCALCKGISKASKKKYKR